MNGKRYDIIKMICKSFEKINVFRLNYDEPILSYIINFTESNPIEDIEENVLHELIKLPKDLYQEFNISSMVYLPHLYQDQDKVEENFPKEDSLFNEHYFIWWNMLLNVSIDSVNLYYI